MTLRRTTFFLIITCIVAMPFVVYKLAWLANSVRVPGVAGFMGRSQTGQLMHDYPVVSFMYNNERIWFNGPDNLFLGEDQPVYVRYPRHQPHRARIDMFIPIWGDTVVYGGIFVLLVLVIAVHPQIVPYRSIIQLSRQRPFVRVVGV